MGQSSSLLTATSFWQWLPIRPTRCETVRLRRLTWGDVQLNGPLAIIWVLMLKELRLEARNKDVVVGIVLFASLVMSIFAIAIEPTANSAMDVGPGVLWAAVTFAGVIGLNRSASHELDGEAIGTMMMAPISRDLVFVGKTLGIFVFMLISTAILLGIFVLLFNVSVLKLEVALIGSLCALGFAGVGTLFSNLTFRVRAREVLLPMFFLPTVTPLLFAAVRVTSLSAAGEPLSASIGWLQLALAYDVVFLVAAALLFGFVLED